MNVLNMGIVLHGLFVKQDENLTDNNQNFFIVQSKKKKNYFFLQNQSKI